MFTSLGFVVPSSVSMIWNGAQNAKRFYDAINQLNRDEVIQLVIACSLPVLMMVLPKRATPVVGSVVGIAFVVVHLRATFSRMEEIEKTKRMNEGFGDLHESLMRVVGEFERAIGRHVKIDGVEEAASKKIDEAGQALEEKDEALRNRLGLCHEKIRVLTELCKAAVDDDIIRDRMSTLMLLNKECSERATRNEKLQAESKELVAQLKELIQELVRENKANERQKAILENLKKEDSL